MRARKSAGSYHHGDLRNALVDSGTQLAREGGPDAVVLREAARRVGVTSAAAYHHFGSHGELIQAVKQHALGLLSDRMRAALAQDQPAPAPEESGEEKNGAAEAARQRLRALGEAYLRFAFDEPGLFRLTFGPRGSWPAADSAEPDDRGSGPFLLLTQVLDDLVAAGAIPAQRRPGLEYVVWAEVHGLAVLCIDGPLARLDGSQRQQTIGQALDAVIRGL
jgi:AcrR family transcriptional regulator